MSSIIRKVLLSTPKKLVVEIQWRAGASIKKHNHHPWQQCKTHVLMGGIVERKFDHRGKWQSTTLLCDGDQSCINTITDMHEVSTALHSISIHEYTNPVTSNENVRS